MGPGWAACGVADAGGPWRPWECTTCTNIAGDPESCKYLDPGHVARPVSWYVTFNLTRVLPVVVAYPHYLFRHIPLSERTEKRFLALRMSHVSLVNASSIAASWNIPPQSESSPAHNKIPERRMLNAV